MLWGMVRLHGKEEPGEELEMEEKKRWNCRGSLLQAYGISNTLMIFLEVIQWERQAHTCAYGNLHLHELFGSDLVREADN